MNKEVETRALFDCTTEYLKPLFSACRYPWEIVAAIGDYIKELLKTGIEGYSLISEGVLVGQNVKIYPTAVIEGPAVIGSGSELRPGAFIRGRVITGENCVIGNSTEVKNSVLLNRAQLPHYNYVGDSVIGNRAHMGAGAVCSNLKSDGSNVTVRGETDYRTGLRKLGGMLADRADIGCGCVLNPGTVVGKNTSAYPLTALRGVYPAECIIKSPDRIVKRI